jgi:hypothetical protein
MTVTIDLVPTEALGEVLASLLQGAFNDADVCVSPRVAGNTSLWVITIEVKR